MSKNPREIKGEEFFALEEGKEKIKFLLHYAILAPSTHNSQPWLFKVTDNSCKIYYDPKLKLPEADPKGRDLFISLGACIENLVIAAKYFGVYKSTAYLNGYNNEVAEIFFNFGTPSTTNENHKSILDTLIHRINKRGIFEPRSIDKSIIEKVEKISSNKFVSDDIHLHITSEKEKIEKLAQLTRLGLEKAYKLNSFRAEISKWMNNSFSSKKHGIPGYSLRMPALLSIIFPFLVKHFNIGKKLGWLNYISFKSAPLVCLISSQNESSEIWVKIGQLAEHLILEFNSNSINTSIFVASIEMGFQKEIQEIIDINALPQFLFVAGYMSGYQKPTLRHSVEEKLI